MRTFIVKSLRFHESFLRFCVDVDGGQTELCCRFQEPRTQRCAPGSLRDFLVTASRVMNCCGSFALVGGVNVRAQDVRFDYCLWSSSFNYVN